MSSKKRSRKDRSRFFIAHLTKSKWLSERILSVLERFLNKDHLRRRLRQVIRQQGPAVREVLNVWEADLDSRELSNILLDRALASAPPPEDREPPLCSVIIPVFNNGTLTYSCLKSLLLAKVTTPFEVIAVDNASFDHAPVVLDHFRSKVTVIRNETNEGFVTACNQGAAAATGRYLLFLNNDTVVPDAWLDRLVATAEEHENVGAVGCKLVFPDGTIQEAGGIVWNDGSACNYGKWKDPDDPHFTFLREVDYCSAACLLVRRDLFEELGGFDTRYAPAYYEDTDLCFGLRSLGYRVLYQPCCEIEHCEGATAGIDENVGFKRFQKINRAKFTAKWSQTLATQSPPGSRHREVAADRRRGPRILVLDWQVPTYDRDSGSLRIFSILKALTRLGYRVSFMLQKKARYDHYARELGGIGVRLVPKKAVRRELAGGRHDLVIASRMNVAERFLKHIRRAAPRLPLIYDTVDVHFVREMRAAELSRDKQALAHAREVRRREIAIARACSLTLAITEADSQHLLREDPTLEVAVLPNVHQPLAVTATPEGRRSLMFIGGFKHPPNRDAMLYFVAEILPLITAELGPVELQIVGSDPPAEVAALSSETIVVTGYVPDTTPYFARSRVFVCPLRYGAGMKGKIGEAQLHGVPVVTTTIGAEGIELVHGETALIQDDESAFAQDVVRLFQDDLLWTRLSAAGKSHIETHFGTAALEERLARIMASFFGS